MTEETTNIKRGVPVWAQVTIWTFLVGLLALVGFGLNRARNPMAEIGEPVPDFDIVYYEGYEYKDKTQMKLSDLQGKVVVINIWASWCKPCEQEAAELQQAWAEFGPTGQVVFLGVDYVDTEPDARVYLQKFGIDFPNGPDMATRISQMFRTTGVPETYFIDQDGVLRYVKVGPFTSADELRSQINALLP